MASLERTFIAIKPDGVQRGLVGDIIKRFEQKGFRLVAMKFLRVTRASRRLRRSPSPGGPSALRPPGSPRLRQAVSRPRGRAPSGGPSRGAGGPGAWRGGVGGGEPALAQGSSGISHLESGAPT